MSEPITWGDYLGARLLLGLLGLAGFALVFLYAFLCVWYQSLFCQDCGSRLKWRWRKPWQYASRRFCPFHDEGRPWP